MSGHYEFIQGESELPLKTSLHSVAKIQPHWHPLMEFILVMEGSAKVTTARDSYNLKKGDFVFINCNQVHSNYKTNEANLLLAVQIDPNFYTGIYPHFEELYFVCHSFLTEAPYQQYAQEIRQRLAQITFEAGKQQPGYRARIGSHLFLLAGLLFNYPFYQAKDMEGQNTPNDLLRLQRIIQYINDNLHQKITLKAISEAEHISYYHLSRFIQQKLGMSFQVFVNLQRLQKATDLLLIGNKSLEEIALAAGFSSTKHFYQIFTQQFNLSPSEYKNKVLGQHLIFEEASQGKAVDRQKSSLTPVHLPENLPAGSTYLDVPRQAALKTLVELLGSQAHRDAAPTGEGTCLAPAQLKLKADARQGGQPFSPYWRELIGFTRAAEGLRQNWQNQLKELQREIGFKQIRFHGLFADEMMIYQTDGMGGVSYNWTYVNHLFDSLLDARIKPFIELGFMPRALASTEATSLWWQAYIAPPKDMAKWQALVAAFVVHLVNRYGPAEVGTWHFEVWNEPELKNLFWVASQEDYFAFYAATVAAVKKVSPASPVGGPAIAHEAVAGSTWLADFLTYCRAKQVPLDFISLHIYPEAFAANPDLGHIQRQLQADNLTSAARDALMEELTPIYHGPDHPRQILQSARAQSEKILGHVPKICVTEWNASAFHRNLIHDTPYVATFIIHHVLRCQGLADMLGYWTFTDINEENPLGKEPFHGSFGLINKDGIKKASYFAYYLLAKLGEIILAQGEGYIITKNAMGVQILVYNYTYFDPLFLRGETSLLTATDRYQVFAAKPAQQWDVEITGVSGLYKISRWCLNRSHGSAFDDWVAMGAPVEMTAEEIKYLQNKSQPQLAVTQETLTDTYHTVINLPVHGVELITLQKIHG